MTPLMVVFLFFGALFYPFLCVFLKRIDPSYGHATSLVAQLAG